MVTIDAVKEFNSYIISEPGLWYVVTMKDKDSIYEPDIIATFMMRFDANAFIRGTGPDPNRIYAIQRIGG